MGCYCCVKRNSCCSGWADAAVLTENVVVADRLFCCFKRDTYGSVWAGTAVLRETTVVADGLALLC